MPRKPSSRRTARKSSSPRPRKRQERARAPAKAAKRRRVEPERVIHVRLIDSRRDFPREPVKNEDGSTIVYSPQPWLDDYLPIERRHGDRLSGMIDSLIRALGRTGGDEEQMIRKAMREAFGLGSLCGKEVVDALYSAKRRRGALPDIDEAVWLEIQDALKKNPGMSRRRACYELAERLEDNPRLRKGFGFDRPDGTPSGAKRTPGAIEKRFEKISKRRTAS